LPASSGPTGGKEIGYSGIQLTGGAVANTKYSEDADKMTGGPATDRQRRPETDPLK
jgi:hypothetical protein